MDKVRRFLIAFFGLTLSVILTVLVMINGWGLEPQSWWWIVGVGVFGQLATQIIIAIAND